MRKLVRKAALGAAALAAVALLAAVYLAVAPATAVPAAAAAAVTLGASPSPSTSPSGSSSPSPSPSATPTPPPPLTFVRPMSPRANARNVSFAARIKIRFSAAIASDTPLPRLRPQVPGTWKIVDSTTLLFVARGHLPIYTKVSVTVPGGSRGVLAVDGARLAKGFTVSFTVGGPSSLPRLRQLLAELNYLPLRFTVPVGGKYVSALGREARQIDLIPLKPRSGRFRWRYHHIPSGLSAVWRSGVSTVVLRGAIMEFESDHKLAADGVAGRAVWTAVLRAASRHAMTKRAYRYVEVSRATQTLRVWSNGRIVYTTACNTGIASRPTAPGTFPVYARYLSTTMSGTNPDGSHYSDPGVPWVAYFNGGDAIHGFLRPGYGWPQSLGCVELPYSAAAVVYRYDPIGTLVAVS